VWQNTTLLEKTLSLLKNASFEIFMHHRVPTNDGGISIGQILIAAATIKNT
jgi:hydrogenase maturation protein HypF